MFTDNEVSEIVSSTHPRPRAPGAVESIIWYIPDAEVVEVSGEIVCNVLLSPEEIEAIRLAYYKYTLVAYYMAIGNNLQIRALSHHTVTHTTASIQQDVYTIKYNQARAYLNDPSVVPPILEAECALVGDNPLDLANEIIANYEASMASLNTYFGTLEGTRRLLKRQILAATSIEQLDNMQRIYLPLYEPTVAPVYEE